jgi:hypothetical protein
MKDTNRSLFIAVLACLSMGLFAKSPQFSGGKSWITIAFLVATVGLSVWGFWVGLRGARKQRTAWSWLAPAVNVLIFITIVAFFSLIMIALKKFQ